MSTSETIYLYELVGSRATQFTDRELYLLRWLHLHIHPCIISLEERILLEKIRKSSCSNVISLSPSLTAITVSLVQSSFTVTEASDSVLPVNIVTTEGSLEREV